MRSRHIFQHIESICVLSPLLKYNVVTIFNPAMPQDEVNDEVLKIGLGF